MKDISNRKKEKERRREYEKARTKKRRIQVRVSEEDYVKILKRASKSQSLNSYMREIALTGKIIESTPSITLEHLLELNRIGNNVNQIAKAVNSAEINLFQKSTRKELEKIVHELREILISEQIRIDELRK